MQRTCHLAGSYFQYRAAFFEQQKVSINFQIQVALSAKIRKANSSSQGFDNVPINVKSYLLGTGFRRGFELHLRVGEFDQSFILNAKSLYFHALASKWAFHFVSRPQIREFDFLLGQIALHHHPLRIRGSEA